MQRRYHYVSGSLNSVIRSLETVPRLEAVSRQSFYCLGLEAYSLGLHLARSVLDFLD
jgi:hypothetical protein